MDTLAQIARTLLYEGYILWPYRRSAPKNRQRWTFGGVVPEAYGATRVNEPWLAQAECLLEGDDDTVLDVWLRFLHVMERRVARARAAGLEYVDELIVGDARHLAWDEATEREVIVAGLTLGDLVGQDTAHHVAIDIPAGTTEELLQDAAGARAGAIVRSWRALRGTLTIRAARVGPRLARVTARVTNHTPWAGGTRDDAMRQSLVSTHSVLRAEGGAFVSLTDPPAGLAHLAAACHNVGCWPVLVGEPGERHTMLASPIILSDHPRVAPESPGDLFDGGEIDQLLVLNILALTDEERREMRDSDPRAREILDRCTSLTNDQLARLHGAVRDFRPIQEGGGMSP